MKKLSEDQIKKIIPDYKEEGYLLTEDEIRNLRERSALSGLPGNTEIKKALTENFIGGSSGTIAVYMDINNFKAYNDNYGFIKGDFVIKTLAGEFSRRAAGFAGHIGGDDFAAIMDDKVFAQFSRGLLSFFEARLRDFYDEADYERGCIITFDRDGNRHSFPLMGITVVAFGRTCAFKTAEDAGEFAAQLKKMAKLRGKKSVGNSIIFKYDGSSVTPLADIIKDEGLPIKIRRSVVEALGEMKDFPYENVLVNILQEPHDNFLKKSALYALGRLRSRETIPVISGFLSDASAHLRMRAVEALGEMGSAQTGSDVAALTADKNFYVKKAAVLALGKIADKKFTDVLRRCLEDRNVHAEAFISLAMLGDEDAVSSLPDFINDDFNLELLRITALRIMSGIKNYRQGLLVLRNIGGKSPVMIVECLYAVSKILRNSDFKVEEEEVKEIFSLVSAKSRKVRRALAEFCGEVKGPVSEKTLEQLSKDFFESVRAKAVEAFGNFPGRAGHLLRFFNDPNVFVRNVAVTSIKFMDIPEDGRGDIVERLRVLLKSPSHEIADNAAKSIIHILRKK
ncbi:MAG: HEAT repeat domain-containing protein [bacterium]